MKPTQNRHQLRRPRRKRRQRRPKLRFSPTAWAKLVYLRDLGPTEVGGFGISLPDDLLYVQDIQLVQQRCTESFVAFDDFAVADYFDDQIDLGRRPDTFGRIWIHTHPGSCPHPSPTDVDTFDRVFGSCDWAVMFIIARGGETFAELHWKAGSASLPMDVEVDYSKPFAQSDHASWEDEYRAKVEAERWPTRSQTHSQSPVISGQQHHLDCEFADLFPDIHDLF